MTAHSRDFRSIRQWCGSQHRSFEELCYQLRDQPPEGAELIKTGDPDAGLEWYVTLPDGVQWGWQVKFTFDVGTLLGLMEKSLKTVIDERPECKQLTFCIPFDLPDALRGRERKSARQKFEDRKKSWRERIPGADRVLVQLWSGGELLERLANHPAQRGKEWFFWESEVFSSDWCAERLAITLQAAGERYSPKLHVDLPVTFALEGLALSEPYWKQFRLRRGEVLGAASRIEVPRYAALDDRTQLLKLVDTLAEWRRTIPSIVDLPSRLDRDQFLARTCDCLRAAYAAYPDEPPSRTFGTATDSQPRLSELFRIVQHELRKLTGVLSDFEHLMESSATAAAHRGSLLLTGEAGQGKTHLFCDFAQRAVNSGQPAIVLFGGRLSGRHVWSEIAEQLGLAQVGSEVLISAMQAAAEASNAPFLLLIDALNDTYDPTAWQEELPVLLAEIARHPWISVGVSVRSTFRQVVLPLDGIPNLVEVTHPGFAEREQDATERFFDFFGLDQPRIPLLTPEFTNPLFLKLYCEGLKGVGPSAPAVGEAHISDVFERHLKWKAKRIVSKLKLDPATQPVKSAIDAFCEALAANNRDNLARDRAQSIIDGFAPKLHRWPDTLFGQLLNEGLLAADVAYDSATSRLSQVVRFTYQRFSDYRVISALLKPLNRDRKRLLAALGPGKALRKRLLKAPAGWIEALSVHLPEQFDVELLDAARWRLVSSKRYQWTRAFVRSIADRNPTAVTKRSRDILSQVQHRSPELRNLVLETLLSIAACVEHPLNANVLHERLKNWSMPVRDVAWSIPTYFAFDRGGMLERLIRWAARGPYPDCPNKVIELASVPLVWTFTSPNRRMRDYATKAVTQLFSGSLSVLPSVIKRFCGVNDPYVMERLAVVCHGAVLCGGCTAPESAVAVSQELKRVALAEEQVPNIITRDAVRGTFEWTLRAGLIDDQAYSDVLPPYGSAPPEKPRTEKQLKCSYGSGSDSQGNHTISSYESLLFSIFDMGDFGCYIIEQTLEWQFTRNPLFQPSLPHDANSRYPTETAQCWVFERVLSLGWNPRAFFEFDSNHVPVIASRDSHKVERFGKKYQWIAFRELVARLADNFHMRTAFDGEPVAYGGPWQFFGRDIDPTLPVPPRNRNEDGDIDMGRTFATRGEERWNPPGPRYRADDPPVDANWAIESDDIPDLEPLVRTKCESGTRWVVLHANYNWNDHVSEEEQPYSRARRKLWIYTYSWLVHPTDQEALVSFLERRSLMGRWMPEGQEYADAAYLGELPWAAAANDANEVTDSWSAPRYRSEQMKLEVYPTWVEYLWEGNVLDCSIEHSVNALLPAPLLFQGGNLSWASGSREWCRSDGTPMAQYRERNGHRALIVREDWLQDTLRNTHHSILFGLLGEKRFMRAGLHTDVVRDWTQIDAIGSLTGDQWAFGKRRLTRLSVQK